MADITLDAIIKAADDGYGNPGLVTIAHCGLDPSDTLAVFIARELRDTHASEDGVADNRYFAAADYMSTASRQLQAVADALRAAGRAFAQEEAP